VCRGRRRRPGRPLSGLPSDTLRAQKHYNYFRDYDPRIGRYIQSDPIGLEAGTATFSYVSGNPIATSDFFGLYQCPANMRPVPLKGHESDYPRIALCVDDPTLNNPKVCATAECAAGLEPRRDVCCDGGQLGTCLSTETGAGIDCGKCAKSKGKDWAACTSCGNSAVNAGACLKQACKGIPR